MEYVVAIIVCLVISALIAWVVLLTQISSQKTHVEVTRQNYQDGKVTVNNKEDNYVNTTRKVTPKAQPQSNS